MAIFSGEVTIKVRFKDIQVAVGYGMTSAIIKHRCVLQAYANHLGQRLKTKKMVCRCHKPKAMGSAACATFLFLILHQNIYIAVTIEIL